VGLWNAFSAVIVTLRKEMKSTATPTEEETTSKSRSILKLVAAIVICQAVGIISGLLTIEDVGAWFETLNKPSWNPPGYVFGPVWTVLYLLMGIALWLVWKNPVPGAAKTWAIRLFAIQLLLNFWWSILFFRFHSPLLALMDIVCLLTLIGITTYSFSRISKAASWLMVPYLLWVAFATCLNFAFWFLN
jgi:benzodiazapine receptor